MKYRRTRQGRKLVDSQGNTASYRKGDKRSRAGAKAALTRKRRKGRST